MSGGSGGPLFPEHREAIDLLAEYHALSHRDRNYQSCLWAGRLAATVRTLISTHASVLLRAVENGQDQFAFDVGAMLRARIDGGATDTELVEAVEAMICARMEVGLPEGQWFGE